MDQPTLSLRYAALSDVGRVRKDNQDSGFASEHLLVIADGVGGAARGDIASATAVQILRRLDKPPPGDLLEALAGAVHRAHDRIAELVEQDHELEGTSTTVTAALFDGSRVGVAHVGDSRGYLLRDGTLRQLTKDHTFVQSLVDEGRITEEESRNHPHRNLILRAVDGVHETDPDLFVVDLQPGDRILLCSDGCSGVLDANRLADILGSGTVDFAVVELVRASLEAGSSDNITCVAADVIGPDTPAADPDTSAAASTGPMLVGAAAEQPRRTGAGAGPRSFFRGHRGGDTGELEPVPGERETPSDPEELRYAPRPPQRFVWLRRLVIAAVVLGLVAVALVAGYRWTQGQYYVASADERVAIYRGVPADLPGVELNSVAERTDLPLAALPPFPAEQVRAGISADDLADAREIVGRMADLAIVCPSPEPTPTASPKATRKPSTKATGKAASPKPEPSASAKPSPSAAPSPTATASPTLAPPDCIESTAGTTP